jgi:hypothetical protein
MYREVSPPAQPPATIARVAPWRAGRESLPHHPTSVAMAVRQGLSAGTTAQVAIMPYPADRNPLNRNRFPRVQRVAVRRGGTTRNPGLLNIRHSISPNQPYYADALAWGEAFLEARGL